MRLALLAALTALSCAAQFRSMDIEFKGVGCASCVESLEGRLQRLRGVQKVGVDVEHGRVRIQLSVPNRVRFEQVRDMIEQDGSRVQSAQVRLQGELSKTDGKWILHPPGASTSYEVQVQEPLSPKPGTFVIAGDVEQPHPQAGDVRLRAKSIEPVE